jgi:hypothetical protein
MEACRLDKACDEVDAHCEPLLGESAVDFEFRFLAVEIDALTANFMRLQRTMTTALERYTWCLLLCERLHDLKEVVIAAENIGFDSQQKAYIAGKIPDLLLMEDVVWYQSRQIKPHLENLLHPQFEMMEGENANIVLL